MARKTARVAIAKASGCGHRLSRKTTGIEEEPDHEVFPVDVDPPPVIGEPRRQQVVMVGLRKLKAEEMKHAGGHVKLTRDLEIEQVVANEVDAEADQVVNASMPESRARGRPGGRQSRWIVPRNIISQPAPLHRVNVVGKVAALHRPVVDHRENA